MNVTEFIKVFHYLISQNRARDNYYHMEILEAFYFLRLKRDFILKLARNYLTRETLQPFPMQRLWFHGSYAF